MTYFATVSFFPRQSHLYLAQRHWEPDFSRPYEIFIDSAKQGSDLAITAEALAIAVSLALQHGAEMRTIFSALPKNADNSPADVVGFVLSRLLDGTFLETGAVPAFPASASEPLSP